MRKPKGYWNNYDNCYNAALECVSKKDFSRKHRTAYISSLKNGWIDDYTWFKRPTNYNKKWTFETCYEAALECKTISEFIEKYPSAYTIACRNKWNDNYTWFERQENFVTDKMHCVYGYFFDELHTVYIGRTNDTKRRDWEHKNLDCPVRRFADKNNVQVPNMFILEKELTRDESLIYEQLYEEQYRLYGWNLINTARTGLYSGSIGGSQRIKWSKVACYEASLKCNSKTEFQKNYSRAYQKSRKSGWLDEFFPNVKKYKIKVNQYTLGGEYIKTWDCISDIKRVNGFNKGAICRCRKGKLKTAYGFIWKYADDETKKAA